MERVGKIEILPVLIRQDFNLAATNDTVRKGEGFAFFPKNMGIVVALWSRLP